jgi:acetoin utilization deacetylase AcuC-like enzyme
MPTLLIENPAGLNHVTPPGHPEQVARLEVVTQALAAPAFATLLRETAPLADEADLLLAHPQDYVDAVRAAIPGTGIASLDPDTHASPGSWDAALKGVGGMIAAVDAVLDGRARNAFVASRPPGHHAERTRAMGFCYFGNVAIGALHALERRGLTRVAVIDFDVHHGNGTQDILWDEPRTLFVSSHQMPLYPGTGAAAERGASNNILNLPLPPGSDGAHMRSIYASRVFPAVRAFAPDLILVSAGFDAHRADPLANLAWDGTDFAWLMREICTLADETCEGRVVSTLEGGYDLSALAASVAAHLTEMMEAAG